MKPKNAKQLEAFIDQFVEIQKQGAEIAKVMLELRGERNPDVEPENIQVDETGTIVAECEMYIGCSEWETTNVYIPFEYFFDENFIEDAKEQVRLEQEAEKRRQEEYKARRKREKEESEHKKYLELKAKFEGDNQ